MAARFTQAEEMRLRRLAFTRSTERRIPMREAWREVQVEALRGRLEESRAAAIAALPEGAELPWYLKGTMA